MLFDFEERVSDSPLVERIWRTRGERAGDFLSVAVSHWELVVSKYRGETVVTVRRPETKPTPVHVTWVGAEWFGIVFKLGTVMPCLPASALVDGSADLPDASSKSFWLDSSAWQILDYDIDNLEESLQRAGRPVTFYRYPGTGHYWFFGRDRPEAYHQQAATLAWERTLTFLRHTLPSE